MQQETQLLLTCSRSYGAAPWYGVRETDGSNGIGIRQVSVSKTELKAKRGKKVNIFLDGTDDYGAISGEFKGIGLV